MIAACRVRGVSHLSPAYMSPLYSKNTILKTWESRFEPILDPAHWPKYNGAEYILDCRLLKDKVGRRKKNGSVMRWIKLVVTVMISMVMVISTKKVRRFGVASAIKRVTEWRSTRRAQKICPKTKEIECREIVQPW